ncbi:MAG: alkaline phosphatase family protein, partial [Terriglobales bacterium]
MRTQRPSKAFVTIVVLAAALVQAAVAQTSGKQSQISHVLLVSIDGMHAVDYMNCSQGVKGINGGQPYCTNLAKLGATAVNYLDTSTSRPSDSFPGLMAIMTGGTPRTMGVFYDVAYDRVYAPPQKTTGNGLKGGPCTVGRANGTSSGYEEGIDINQKFLNGIDGISTKNGDGGINSIDPARLIRDPFNNCLP